MHTFSISDRGRISRERGGGGGSRGVQKLSSYVRDYAIKSVLKRKSELANKQIYIKPLPANRAKQRKQKNFVVFVIHRST